MGFFDVDDPADCDKPKHPDTDDHSTPAHFITYGAVKCCKSQKVDQAVCKIDKCVSEVMKCFESHAHDIEASEKKLTNPKAMDKNDEGEMEGSCLTAISNGVEGALCCTAAMEKMTTCISERVGDYKMCKESWNKAFGADHFDKAEAVMNSFKSGGYCASNVSNATMVAGTPLPCAQASDFNGNNPLGDDYTCQDLSAFVMPSSAKECNDHLGDGPETKGEVLKHMYAMCCEPGSKPNQICGFELNTITPCASKADGEFLPKAR